MLLDILEYLSNERKQEIESLNVSILVNNIEEVIASQIIEIAKRVKSLKIITTNINSFLYIEEKLYIEYGIAIQITNNKDKALLNSQIVLNFDFNEEKLKEYDINSLATIVNIKSKINNLNFNGNIINYYKIAYNEEILKEFDNKEDFDSNILYESLVYRRDNFYNIRKQFKQDGVRFIGLF